MMNNKERKMKRMNCGNSDTLSATTYNLIIGLVTIYGFVVNALMVLFCGDMFTNINPVGIIVGYFIAVIAGSIMVVKSRNPVFSFIGYNLIVLPIGVLLTIFLPGFSAGTIMSAMIATGVVTLLMLVASMAFPNFFAGLGKTLLMSLIFGIIIELIATLMGYGGDVFNWFFVIIFSCYIGYDWHVAQAYPKTIDNAIDSAVDIYLDIINIFIRLIEIFGRRD